ncbi:hypothetical protein NQ318_023648, partial [Aromia moschata]
MGDVKWQLVKELHKPVRNKFRRRRVTVKGLNDLIQADLVEMIRFARVNRGYRYILVVINVFSKFVWTEPVKRKTAKETNCKKTNHPDVYLIEKVIRKKGTQFLVKWLGMDSSHNSWIDKKRIGVKHPKG